jgi:hypothetical protein
LKSSREDFSLLTCLVVQSRAYSAGKRRSEEMADEETRPTADQDVEAHGPLEGPLEAPVEAPVEAHGDDEPDVEAHGPLEGPLEAPVEAPVE